MRTAKGQKHCTECRARSCPLFRTKPLKTRAELLIFYLAIQVGWTILLNQKRKINLPYLYQLTLFLHQLQQSHLPLLKC